MSNRWKIILFLLAFLAACTPQDQYFLEPALEQAPAPAQELTDDRPGTIVVEATCGTMHVELAGWPDDFYTIMGYGAVPPMGQPINTTFTHKILNLSEGDGEISWAVDVFRPDGVLVGYQHGVVVC